MLQTELISSPEAIIIRNISMDLGLTSTRSMQVVRVILASKNIHHSHRLSSH